MALIQKTIEKTRSGHNDYHIVLKRCCRWRNSLSRAIWSLHGAMHMTYGRAVSLLVLTAVLFPSLVSAQVNGVWDVTNNGCSDNFRLTIATWEDGTPIGKITAPGFQGSIYNVVVEGNRISFSFDQQDKYALVTYDYDAKFSGNTMTGTCRSEEVPSRTGAFAARRGGTTEIVP